jgi:hypothetical protein
VSTQFCGSEWGDAVASSFRHATIHDHLSLVGLHSLSDFASGVMPVNPRPMDEQPSCEKDVIEEAKKAVEGGRVLHCTRYRWLLPTMTFINVQACLSFLSSTRLHESCHFCCHIHSIVTSPKGFRVLQHAITNQPLRACGRSDA